MLCNPLYILNYFFSGLVGDRTLYYAEFTIWMNEGLYLGLCLLLEGIGSTLAFLSIVDSSDVVISVLRVGVELVLFAPRVWIGFLRYFSELIVFDCIFL